MREKRGQPAAIEIKAIVPIAALILLVLVGLAYRQWGKYRDANAKAAHAREVLDSSGQLVSSLTDAETGQRGFLLTGEEKYLEPYNRAVHEIPKEVSTLSRLLTGGQDKFANATRLKALTNEKLAEISETIEVRRSRGLASSLALVMSDRGKQTMDEIRALCAEIRRTQIATQSQASAEGEAAAGTALLATIAGSLTLLFLFAFGMEPFASPEPKAWQRLGLLRYGAAVLSVLAIVVLRAALIPLIGRSTLPFTLFFCAVAFTAWFGGFRPAVLSIALSLLAGAYFFAEPGQSLKVSGRTIRSQC